MTAIQYIDLQNINLSPNGDAVTIKGIFNAIKNTRKRVVLTNVKLGTTERHDISGSINLSNGKYIITQAIDTGIRSFEISSNDSIKFITRTWSQLNA